MTWWRRWLCQRRWDRWRRWRIGQRRRDGGLTGLRRRQYNGHRNCKCIVALVRFANSVICIRQHKNPILSGDGKRNCDIHARLLVGCNRRCRVAIEYLPVRERCRNAELRRCTCSTIGNIHEERRVCSTWPRWDDHRVIDCTCVHNGNIGTCWDRRQRWWWDSCRNCRRLLCDLRLRSRNCGHC